jgi:hypothetical protein
MYNFRYHVITVIAILLALLIGVILGVSINVSGVAATAGNTLATSLMQRLDDQQGQMATLSQQNSTDTSLLTGLTSAWSKGRLKGSTVALFYANEQSKQADDLRSDLKKAGATVVSVEVLKPGFLDAADAPKLLKEWTAKPLGTQTPAGGQGTGSSTSTGSSSSTSSSNSSSTTTGSATSASTSTAATGATGSSNAAVGGSVQASQPCTQKYLSARAIKVDGDLTAVSAVVDMALSDTAAEPSALTLSAQFNSLHYGAVCLYGPLAQAAQSEGLSCSTAVGTTIGEYSVIALLSGATPGVYGSDQDASHHFPAVPK